MKKRDIIVNPTRYYHSSMIGTYLVDCKILEDTGKEYLISYIDPFTDKYTKSYVPKGCVEK